MSGDELLQQLIDRPWLRSAALSCVLPAVRINGQWQYRRSDLDQWLATQPEGPNA